jgi:hypothetical protein
MDSASGGWPRLLISLASPTQRGAPSFAFLAKGFEEVGRISNGKSAWRHNSRISCVPGGCTDPSAFAGTHLGS